MLGVFRLSVQNVWDVFSYSSLSQQRIEKLTERFVGPYRIKKIISLNAVELELPSIVKIHSVVNVSRMQRYIGQVEEQRKEQPAPVIIKGEEEWEVERILNKWRI